MITLVTNKKVMFRENSASICCNAKVYANSDICSCCKEHSDFITTESKDNVLRSGWNKLDHALMGGFKPGEMIMLCSHS